MEARIVLGAVASCPLRAFEAEKLLVGGSLTVEGSLTRIENTGSSSGKTGKTDGQYGYDFGLPEENGDAVCGGND